MILLLKKYLQTFESFELVDPELEMWYTEETNLSLIFETYWVQIPIPKTCAHRLQRWRPRVGIGTLSLVDIPYFSHLEI
jgi:hypothetical protein